MNVRSKPKYSEIDLTNNTSLPRINENSFEFILYNSNLIKITVKI